MKLTDKMGLDVDRLVRYAVGLMVARKTPGYLSPGGIPREKTVKQRQIDAERLDAVVIGLEKLGWHAPGEPATRTAIWMALDTLADFDMKDPDAALDRKRARAGLPKRRGP